MRNKIINLLFSMLGESNIKLYGIHYLFGAMSGSHEARKNRWKKALIRLWKDKDMLDYLYYQSESDKEKVFQGKINKELSRGARIRTLFIVHSAKMAYLESIKTKRSEVSENDSEMKKTGEIYKELVAIK